LTPTKNPPPDKEPLVSAASEADPSDAAGASTSASPGTPERVVQLYGDMLFDLCESVLWSPVNAQLAFRSILKTLRRRRSGHGYTEFERAWVLQIACEKLIDLSARHGRRLTSSEQIQLDSAHGVTSRLKQFDSYFHRLVTEDQILMILRDKYGMPYPEIASALGVPESNLKVRRAQALRSLEEWLWDGKQ
jgi:DNA-directed RNA polymerase specialized sigma24 family protein